MWGRRGAEQSSTSRRRAHPLLQQQGKRCWEIRPCASAEIAQDLPILPGIGRHRCRLCPFLQKVPNSPQKEPILRHHGRIRARIRQICSGLLESAVDLASIALVNRCCANIRPMRKIEFPSPDEVSTPRKSAGAIPARKSACAGNIRAARATEFGLPSSGHRAPRGKTP